MEAALTCRLCLQPLVAHRICDGADAFCCHGCRAVYAILSARGEKASFTETQIFQRALHAGLISNPQLVEQLRQNNSGGNLEEMRKFHCTIGEIWCPSCAEVIMLLLQQEKGVKSCFVDYATDLAVVEYAPRLISREKIVTLIESFGYTAKPLEGSESKKVSRSLSMRSAVACFCALNAMMFASPLYVSYFDFDGVGYSELFSYLSFASAVPVIGYSSLPIFRRFASALSFGLFGMEALVTLSVSSAFILSTYNLWRGSAHIYYDSMSVIIAFMLIGKIIESKAKFCAKEAMVRLHRSLPRKARRRSEDGTFYYQLAKELSIGDIIEVRMGETVPVDGEVVQGKGFCNEAVMNGEFLPHYKSIGSKVIGGSSLQQGTLAIAVGAKSEDSFMQRIVDTISADIGKKAPYVRSTDKIVRWFVPSVLIIAAASALVCYWQADSHSSGEPLNAAFLRALTVCLIACPCALGIAAPLAESQILTKMVELGAIVRNRGCLSYLGKEDLIIFDKTGTITTGQFSLLRGIEDLTLTEKGILKGLVIRSNHPVARAIADGLKEVTPADIEFVEEIAGNGLSGDFNQGHYFLGSRDFITSHNIEVATPHPEVGQIITEVYFGEKGRANTIATLELGDELRGDVGAMLSACTATKTLLLSGDGEAVVASVAKACGFDSYYASASPLSKQELIARHKGSGSIVAMVGDGINDAPALTSAHVGISVVSASDISIHVSDIFLTHDNLSIIAELRSLACRGRRVIAQNIFWAFFYNSAGIALAAFGLLSPLFAAFAMVASSLIVLFNARRI